MSEKCQMVVFSNKAYNAIIRESFDKDPVETGGILLGHILDNGIWIVMEVLPPGVKCIFERAYFEYDDVFVNYLAQSVANQYKVPLELLGLWHRHPGSMDMFSSTDDGTNTTFALQNPNGVISGLVNIDPRFRLTMYHMENPRNATYRHARPNYERIDVEVGDDIIPEEYFQLRYYDGDGSNLNPFVEHSQSIMSRSVRTKGVSQRQTNDKPTEEYSAIDRNLSNTKKNHQEFHDSKTSEEQRNARLWSILKKNKIAGFVALVLVIVVISSFKPVIEWCKSGVETVISWVRDDDKKESYERNDNKLKDKLQNSKLSVEELELSDNEKVILKLVGVENVSEIVWTSTDDSVATVINGEIVAKKSGRAKISALFDGKEYFYDVTVKDSHAEDLENKIVIKINSWNSTGTGEILVTDTYVVPIDKPSNVDRELITFKSENTEIATVSDKGLVTPKAVGTTKIFVLYKGREQDSLLLRIKENK